MEPPKTFISYSWSSPEHEQWVLNLATYLMNSGVEVLFDKWELKEGHDTIKFMEKMVNDPEVKKVIIVADKAYKEKANKRVGGVGTETSIISKDIYDNQDQDKFAAVVREKDEKGEAYLPTYYKSRIYIDFSEDAEYSESFEQLLRWIFGKPLYIKPDIGERPSYLDDESISLGTAIKFKRAIDAITNGKSHAAGALEEYLNTFAKNLERFRIEKSDEEYDDVVMKNIENFLPYRNEAIRLFNVISQYAPSEVNINKLHRFFEILIPYMYSPANVSYWNELDYDNFRLIIHELFLYVIAILIKNECFENANHLLEQQYYLPGNYEYGRNAMVDFTVFRQGIHALDHRNERLGLRRVSLRSDLLKDRCIGIEIEFRHLMQADFVLFMRAEVSSKSDWWPDTLLYIKDFYGPFEIFARATSKKYFDSMKCLLAINTPEDLEDLINSYKERKRQLPSFGGKSFSPYQLICYEQLAKRLEKNYTL